MKTTKILLFLSLIFFFFQCTNDPILDEEIPVTEEESPILDEEITVCDDDYCITEVNIDLSNNSSQAGATEGSKKIDLNNDEIDDIKLGIGYRRSSSELERFVFSIETIQPQVFIASNSYIDTIYECQNDTSNADDITRFNANSDFICSNSGTVEIYETSLTYYPTPSDFYEPSNSNFEWINDRMILSSFQNSPLFSMPDITIFYQYDYWLNQTAKYILFEIRGEITKKAFIKLDTNETGSLHIYEIGIEKD